MIGRLFAAGALLALAGTANADMVVESATLGGSARVNMMTGQFVASSVVGSGRTIADRAGSPPAVLYNNLTTPAAAQNGLSRAGTGAIWGDRVTTTGTGGALEEFAFTVFNSSTSNTVTMTTGTINVEFRRGADNSLLGALSFNITPVLATFAGGGLAPGSFGIFDFINISQVSDVEFDTTDVLITQALTGANGGRYGVASFNPIVNGASANSAFLSDPTSNPVLAPGLYTFGNPAINANPGYFVFIPTPGAAGLLGLGGLVAMRRRR